MELKLQVTKCVKSYQWANMWVVTYTTSKNDFFTGAEIVSEEHKMFSAVEIEPGERTVVKDCKKVKRENPKTHKLEEVELFWIKEVKE